MIQIVYACVSEGRVGVLYLKHWDLDNAEPFSWRHIQIDVRLWYLSYL